MSSNQIKLVLFDLGGVLVELGDQLFPKSWIPDNQNYELKEWLSSETAIKFETGLISSSEFVSELKRTLSIMVSEHEIYTAFKSWPKRLFPDTDRLIERLKSDYRVAVLSNSNEIHEPIIMRDFELDSRIDDVFFSHLIGYSKPSHEAFNCVLTNLGFEPKEVIFFDDSEVNVLAAQSLGIQAYLVSNPMEVEHYI
jgi:HAD superfamily hydrolase (TIGR01509 family)